MGNTLARTCLCDVRTYAHWRNTYRTNAHKISLRHGKFNLPKLIDVLLNIFFDFLTQVFFIIHTNITSKIVYVGYAYNQTQSTDVFTHYRNESNAKLHENCIFFAFYHLFYYLFLFYIKIIYFLLIVIVLLPSFSLFNDNFNNISIITRHSRCIA